MWAQNLEGTPRERHPLPVEEGSRLSLQPRSVVHRKLGVNSAVLYPPCAFMSSTMSPLGWMGLHFHPDLIFKTLQSLMLL